MRTFQNMGIPASYGARLAELRRGKESHSDLFAALLHDRFAASHLLKPILEGDASAFLATGNDVPLQQAWARENGLRHSASMEEILLAQIEEHRAEVFYNLDPIRYDSRFVRRLPAGVKHKLCWRAAPTPHANFGAYDLVVCNFHSIIEMWTRLGFRSAFFAPAHDPAMDDFADANHRPLDIVFAGGYTRHHTRRNQLLEAVASLSSEFRVVMSLDVSRLTKLAETPLGFVPPLGRHRRTRAIRSTSSAPRWGRDLYALMASSRIVFNAAIDMSGKERGNLRCFEAMGCGALLVTDLGEYPPGMDKGKTMLEYRCVDDVVDVLRSALNDWNGSSEIAARGQAMVRTKYGKDAQWASFQSLL